MRGASGHGGSVIGDAVAMEGGLHHAALTEPEFALAGKQAVAEDVTIGAEDAALDEFFIVVDEDVFDVFGMEKRVGAEIEEAEADDVAVIASDAGHEGERIAAEGAAKAVEEAFFWAGRVEGHGEMVRGKSENGKLKMQNGAVQQEAVVEILRCAQDDNTIFCGCEVWTPKA
jgi:hypothetical protein